MDEVFTQHLKCDIELDVSGPNDATINRWVAGALRKLADQIEKDELDSGFNDLKDSVGKKIGTIYLDHYGHSESI
tara:strand:+ start:810 stop:1034 length:225 start_codon:yes stop_codon:yes gene_type:complete